MSTMRLFGNFIFFVRQKALQVSVLTVLFCLVCGGTVLGAGLADYRLPGDLPFFDFDSAGYPGSGGGGDSISVQNEPQEKPSPAGRAESQIILLVLDKLTLQDLLCAAGPELTSILEKGAVALMNVNTASAPGTEGGYLTMGAGTRLRGNWAVRRAFNKDEQLSRETVEVLYRRHTGKTEPPPGDVLHPYSGVLQRLNEGVLYPVCIGALGEALHAGNLAAAVLGNADTDTPNRQAVAIAMDREGMVRYGDVGSGLLREKVDFPFGCGSDHLAYLEVFKSLQQKAAFFVVEWGDTSRLDSYLEHLPTERRTELLQAAFQELDLFLKGIKPYVNEDAGLLIVSPSPPRAAFAGGQRLTPVVYYRPGLDGGGILVSPATRRPGIITNLDIAPSILHHLGLESPPFFFGAPLQVMPAADHLQRILTLSENTARLSNQRPGVIKGYILAQIILLLGGLAGLLYRFRPAKVLRSGLYALLFFPPALLLGPVLPFYPAASLSVNVFALLGLTVLLTFVARLLFKELLPLFAFTGLLVFGLLAADLCAGAYLNSQSFLGYDPVGGARFYGLGNEYMGIMIGALILGFGSLYSFTFRKEEICFAGFRLSGRKGLFFMAWLFIVLSFFVLYLLASPLYGANFGGAVTAGVAFSVTLGGMLVLLRQKGLGLSPFSFVNRMGLFFLGRGILFRPRCGSKRAGEGERPAGGTVFPDTGEENAAGNAPAPFLLPQKILLLTIFVLVTAVFLYFLNTSCSDAALSHVGRTWELVCSRGPAELVNVARRKMEMNLKLLRFSLWSRILFIFIFLITLLYFYPVGLTRRIFGEEPGFKLALGGIIAGSFTAFLVNDSGVVAAATTMLYGALPLLLLCFQRVFP